MKISNDFRAEIEPYGIAIGQDVATDPISKLIHLLISGAVLIIIFSIIPMGKLIGNPIGSFLHYGTCPNCGDSWLWKTSGSIKWGEIKDLSSEYGTPSVPFIEIEHGVMICKQCLANPAGLDEVRIEQDLLKYEWPPENVAQVKEAVIRYKKEKGDKNYE